MPINRKDNGSSIKDELNEKMARLRKRAINGLFYIGEKAIEESRTYHTYTDRSGNLTSSMGYAISQDGEVIMTSSFEKIKDGDDGSKIGKSIAEKLARGIDNEFGLVVVAGMEYAEWVAHYKNVLQSSKIVAERLVKKMLPNAKLISKE